MHFTHFPCLFVFVFSLLQLNFSYFRLNCIVVVATISWLHFLAIVLLLCCVFYLFLFDFVCLQKASIVRVGGFCFPFLLLIFFICVSRGCCFFLPFALYSMSDSLFALFSLMPSQFIEISLLGFRLEGQSNKNKCIWYIKNSLSYPEFIQLFNIFLTFFYSSGRRQISSNALAR